MYFYNFNYFTFSLLLGSFLSSNEQYIHKHFSAAMLLSVPWNLIATSENIEKPILNRMLCSYLAKCLCNLVKGSVLRIIFNIFLFITFFYLIGI